MKENSSGATANARTDASIPNDELSSDSTTYDLQKDPGSRVAIGDKTAMPASDTVIDTQLHSNSSTESASFTSSWLIIEVSNLQVPENLLLFLPLVLFFPAIVKWFRLKRLTFSRRALEFYRQTASTKSKIRSFVLETKDN